MVDLHTEIDRDRQRHIKDGQEKHTGHRETNVSEPTDASGLIYIQRYIEDRAPAASGLPLQERTCPPSQSGAELPPRATMALAALAVASEPPAAVPGAPPCPDGTLPPAHLLYPPEPGNFVPDDVTLWCSPEHWV